MTNRNELFEKYVSEVNPEVAREVNERIDCLIAKENMKRGKVITPEFINELKENEVFVFGSNRNGNHLGGAAKIAYEKFGAEWGVGEGHTGQSYALPTLNKDMQRVTEEELEKSFVKFLQYADNNRQLVFYVTKVGCGIAGWDIEDVKRIFWKAMKGISPDSSWGGIPSNIRIPIEFI